MGESLSINAACESEGILSVFLVGDDGEILLGVLSGDDTDFSLEIPETYRNRRAKLHFSGNASKLFSIKIKRM